MYRSMHISMDISMDMGPGPGRAHALSEDGCQGLDQVPGPAGPGPTRQPSSLSTWARPGPGPISMDMPMDICMNLSMDRRLGGESNREIVLCRACVRAQSVSLVGSRLQMWSPPPSLFPFPPRAFPFSLVRYVESSEIK